MTDTLQSSGPGEREREAATQLLESVYELAGGSMSPTLERGWKVLVEPLDRPLERGDVILIEYSGGYLIHRFLGTVTWGSPPREYVVEAGDSSSQPGVVSPSRVRGRVRRVLRPNGQRLLSLHELPEDVQRRLLRFVGRWEFYARLRRLGDAIPGLHRLLAGAPERGARRTLGIG